MGSFGFAHVIDPKTGKGGWGKTETGQIKRATFIVDKAIRLLVPFWGPVPGEPYRGNAKRPEKKHSAIHTVVRDRALLLLSPLATNREIFELDAAVADDPNNAKRVKVVVTFKDGDKRPHRISFWVRIP